MNSRPATTDTTADSRDTSGKIQRALAQPALFDGGPRRVPLQQAVAPLRDEAAKYLVERGFTSRPLPLEELHHHVSAEDQAWTTERLSRASCELASASPGLLAAYHDLVRLVAREVLGFDVVFERDPPLRFHFPVPAPQRFRAPDGSLLTHHSDILLGDYFEQINMWLPLTDAAGSASLLATPFETSIEVLRAFAASVGYDFERFRTGRTAFYELLVSDDALRGKLSAACLPVPVRWGDLLMFDPRVVHGTAENREGTTRVSIDFRVVPLDAYERLVAEDAGKHTIEGHAAVRGGFYDERSAFQL